MKSLEEILQGEDIATFLTRCRTNFKFFCERVLSGTLGEEIKIQPFHLEWFRMFWENPRSVVIAARGTGKTTVLSVAFPLWLSLFFKHKHFMVVSNAMHQSVDIIEKIRLYIEENELLHQLKPKAQSLSWSRTELNTTTGCRIVAKPLNANIRGIHNDYLVCVRGDTLIDTIDGAKPIKLIKPGDLVRTHKNRFRKVIRVFERDANEVIELKSGSNILYITPNHPVAAMTRQKHNNCISWKKAENLRLRDFTIYPSGGKNPFVWIPKIGKKKLPRYVSAGKIAWLMGIYCAEGSTGRREINFTVGAHESQLAHKIEFILKCVFNDTHITKDTHNPWSINLKVSSVALKKFFEKHCGKHAQNKKVPDFIFKCNTKAKAQFLKGWLDGDGDHNPKSGITATTTSDKLKDGILKIAADLSLKVTCRKRNNLNVIYFSANSYRKILSLCDGIQASRYIYNPIQSLRRKKIYSKVYNLEVEEDNSYIANGIVVHNCDEAGLYDDPNLFFRAIVPTVTARKGHIMVIGTPISQTDLLARLSENPAYKVKVYPIIIGKKLLWPEKYSREFIRKLRNELAPDDFAREYLCKIVDSEISVFPFKLLVKSFDKNLSFEQEPDGKSFYFVGCDFALAAKGDYSAFVVVKKREDGKIQLVNIYRTRGQPFEAQLETLKAIYNMYKPQKMLLDRSSFGEAFLSELAREGLPVTGFSFTQENRNSLFNSAIRKFQEQSIVIPYAERDMETVGQVDNLIKELTSFVVDKTRAGYATYVSRGKHDDCAIAFLLALKAAFEERPFLPYITSGTIAEKYPERFTIETH